MDVTFETSQAEMFWLKEDAQRNILSMDATFETSQPEMFWLKDDAPQNILSMDAMFETSSIEMSSLKWQQSSNNQSMSVTSLASHCFMWPCAALALGLSETHNLTASRMVLLLNAMHKVKAPEEHPCCTELPTWKEMTQSQPSNLALQVGGKTSDSPLMPDKKTSDFPFLPSTLSLG